MLGGEPRETQTTVTELVAAVHPQDAGELAQHFKAVLKSGADYAGEYRVRTPAGDWCWIQARGKVVERDAKGRPIVAPKNSSPAMTQAAAPAAVGAETPTEASQKPIRSVGPKFLPTQ